MKKIDVDKIGTALSITCLIHCLFLPVIIATIPFMAFMSFLKDPRAEFLLLICAVTNAAFSIKNIKHKNLIVPAIFISGIFLMIFQYFSDKMNWHTSEYVLTFGAFLLGIGHLINHWSCKTCHTCNNIENKFNEQ